MCQLSPPFLSCAWFFMLPQQHANLCFYISYYQVSHSLLQSHIFPLSVCVKICSLFCHIFIQFSFSLYVYLSQKIINMIMFIADIPQSACMEISSTSNILFICLTVFLMLSQPLPHSRSVCAYMSLLKNWSPASIQSCHGGLNLQGNLTYI